MAYLLRGLWILFLLAYFGTEAYTALQFESSLTPTKISGTLCRLLSSIIICHYHPPIPLSTAALRSDWDVAAGADRRNSKECLWFCLMLSLKLSKKKLPTLLHGKYAVEHHSSSTFPQCMRWLYSWTIFDGSWFKLYWAHHAEQKVRHRTGIEHQVFKIKHHVQTLDCISSKNWQKKKPFIYLVSSSENDHINKAFSNAPSGVWSQKRTEEKQRPRRNVT